VQDADRFGAHDRKSAVSAADARVHPYSALHFGYWVALVVEIEFYIHPNRSTSHVTEIEESTVSKQYSYQFGCAPFVNVSS
jgi:hypothetical protein